MWFKWKTHGTVHAFHETANPSTADIDKILTSDSLDKFALIASETGLIHAWQPKPEDEAYLRSSGTEPWVLLYHDGATGQHLRTADRVTLEQIRYIFQSYLAGGEAWRQGRDWQELRVQAELRAAQSESRAVFKWQGLEDREGNVEMEVTLECVDFRATATVCGHDEALPMLRFLEEIGSLSGDWQRTFRTWNLSMTSWGRTDGELGIAIKVDANIYDPGWTATQRLILERAAWPEIIEQFRGYLAAAEGT